MLADRRGEVKGAVKGVLEGVDATTLKFAASSSQPAYIRILEDSWWKMVLMFGDMLSYSSIINYYISFKLIWI